MKSSTIAGTIVLAVCMSASAFAKGQRSSIPPAGTGSKSTHSHVTGHVKRDGTYVAPHGRSTPDRAKNNNWSTKGNSNPETGRPGAKRGDY